MAGAVGDDHELSAVENDLLERASLIPRAVPIFDVMIHRHCLDCGLPVVRYTPLGDVFDFGINRVHRCPSDPGQNTMCLCGALVVALMSGRVLDADRSQPHRCEYTEDLGYRLALMPAPPELQEIQKARKPKPARTTVDIP